MSSRKLTDAQLATEIQELIGSPPPIGRGSYVPEMGKWAGRATAVIKEYRGQVPLTVTAGTISIGSGSSRESGVVGILIALEAALAEINLSSLAGASGDAAFAGGQQLDVYKRLSQTLVRAQRRLRVIDPYLDDVIVTDYLSGMRSTVAVELLTSDNDGRCFARLKTAAKRHMEQNGASLTVRNSRAIHDRVIFIDELNECVVMGSSIKDAATRKPTYLATLDQQIGAEKRRVYDQIWDQAAPVSL